MKTPSSSASSPTCPSTRSCSRMSFKKSSETRQATRGDALLGGSLRRQYAKGVWRDQGDAIVGVLPQPERSADGAAAADAGGGADAGSLRLSAPARVVVTRRLGGWQRALLSCVHRGGTGAPAQATLATCQRR